MDSRRMLINRPKISIIIPVYNREKIISETLLSAAGQTYKNTEIIVVDNKSTDNTYEILIGFAEKQHNVKIYRNLENIGPVRNWRKCLEYSTGEYIKILWSDDLISPRFLEMTVPYLEKDKDTGFVFTGTEIFDNDTKERKKAYYVAETGVYSTADFIERSLSGADFLASPGNALFRRKDIEKNLLIDVPNKIGSDFKMHAIGNDLLIYLLTAKDYSKYAFISEKLSFFRIHPDSITVAARSSDKTLFYNLARMYFTENYVKDEKVRKRFNALMYVYFFSRIPKNDVYANNGIRAAKDLYFSPEKYDVDYGYLFTLIAGKYAEKIKRVFARYF